MLLKIFQEAYFSRDYADAKDAVAYISTILPRDDARGIYRRYILSLIEGRCQVVFGHTRAGISFDDAAEPSPTRPCEPHYDTPFRHAVYTRGACAAAG